MKRVLNEGIVKAIYENIFEKFGLPLIELNTLSEAMATTCENCGAMAESLESTECNQCGMMPETMTTDTSSSSTDDSEDNQQKDDSETKTSAQKSSSPGMKKISPSLSVNEKMVRASKR